MQLNSETVMNLRVISTTALFILHSPPPARQENIQTARFDDIFSYHLIFNMIRPYFTITFTLVYVAICKARRDMPIHH
jgi:hypothetical protein